MAETTSTSALLVAESFSKYLVWSAFTAQCSLGFLARLQMVLAFGVLMFSEDFLQERLTPAITKLHPIRNLALE
jgi:hypothetical protein